MPHQSSERLSHLYVWGGRSFKFFQCTTSFSPHHIKNIEYRVPILFALILYIPEGAPLFGISYAEEGQLIAVAVLMMIDC